MNGYRSAVVLCALCGLLVSAFAAQLASAAGTTAYTCTTGGKKDYASADTHCQENKGANNGTLGHITITNGTTTHARVTNEITGGEEEASTSSSVFAGVEFVLSANIVESTEGAWLENKEEGGEMFARGEGKLLYKNVKVTKPANCKVVSTLGEGVVETTQLEATTKGQGDAVLFKPVVGEVIAEFEIKKTAGTCLAEQKVKTVGSVKGFPEGATINFDSATITAEGTLRLGSKFGPKVGVDGTRTVKAAKSGETTQPISPTT